MLRRALNFVLLIVFLGAVALLWAVRREPMARNVAFMPEMVRSARYNAYAPNPNTPDEKTLQAGVAGTIPRGFLPLHFQATPEDALRAGAELRNPYSLNDALALDRGLFVYVNYCQTCHGAMGMGDGAVVARGFPAPPSLVAPRAVQMKDGQMFHIVTYGQKNMASYASQISREDRWMVIVHVRSLQKQAAAVAEAAAATANATTGNKP